MTEQTGSITLRFLIEKRIFVRDRRVHDIRGSAPLKSGQVVYPSTGVRYMSRPSSMPMSEVEVLAVQTTTSLQR